jgi:Ca2+/Na+ antiporter
MNITFSFTTRLTIIALLSFLIFFIVSLIVVYELGKEHAIEIMKEENQRISLDKKKNTQLDQSTEGKK